MIAIAKAVNGSFEGIKYPNNKEKLFTDKDGKVCQNFYNLMKMCYALFFSGRRKEMLPYLTIGFTLIIVLNVALLIFFYLH
jgi:hypothetical protein